jgi:MOSC domain-containing protein YiiM
LEADSFFVSGRERLPKVIAVCSGARKGGEKDPLERATLVPAHGVADDVDAGPWHRQVSVLVEDALRRVTRRQKAAGAYGENILLDAIPVEWTRPGTKIRLGKEAVIRVTQLGAEPQQDETCSHRACTDVGSGGCVLLENGIFAEVLTGGEVAAGDFASRIAESSPGRTREWAASIAIQGAMALLFAFAAVRVHLEGVLRPVGANLAVLFAVACVLYSVAGYARRARSSSFVRTAPVLWGCAAFLTLFGWLALPRANAVPARMDWRVAFALTWLAVAGVTCVVTLLVVWGARRRGHSLIV